MVFKTDSHAHKEVWVEGRIEENKNNSQMPSLT